MKIKPESEISCHTTLLDIFTTVVCTEVVNILKTRKTDELDIFTVLFLGTDISAVQASSLP